MSDEIKKGLLGIVVDETEVSKVMPEINSLTYRGYAAQDLCAKCKFEEIAYLILNGELPNKKQLKNFEKQERSERKLSKTLLEDKKRFPKKKVVLLIDENDPKKLNKKIAESDISFIFPHQLELITDNFYDVTIAINCFHEMDQKILKNYFKNINLISHKLYFSIWKKSKNWFSGGIFKKTEKRIS